MRHFLLSSIFLFILKASLSQILIEGKVLNQETRKPVPFANIGIFKSNMGTLSNTDGSFLLRLVSTHANDTVSFSSLGFEKKSIPIQELLKSSSIIIYLVEKTTLLNEVNIREKKLKPKYFVLGNSKMKGGVMQADTLYAGRSVSLLIENKNAKPCFQFPAYVEKARLRILRNNLKSIKFRVRLNERDERTGLPGNDMLQQNLVVESTMRSGWLEFDLSHFNLMVSKPFFITFEQLTDRNDRIAIANGYRKFMNEHPDRVKYDTIIFEGKKVVRQVFKRGGIDLPGAFIAVSPSWQQYTSYVRETSFGDWEKVRGIVTATVTLSQIR